jgi:tetratricopeptide (TPR) repeat protein
MRGLSSPAFLVLLVASMAAPAAEPPAIPEHADPKRYEGMPEPWRDYLLQARAAERIADPLQRCLAFPDIPGNHWPAGHAAAHCRYHFAHKPPSLAEIAAMLDNGKVAELEALVDASQQRHFSEQDFGEDIHRIFDRAVFDGSAESDRATAKWLALRPDSAYANLARGQFLASSAWDARGGKYASQTPRASLRRMSELVGEAIPYLEKSLKIDPRLMPAYTVLINIGMMDSREDVESDAFERAKKIDPACVELARMRMNALEPRWGGSYEEMLGYASELKQYLPGRPQLAIHVEKPFADRGDRLIGDDRYTDEAIEVLDAAVAIGSDEEALYDAADAAINSTGAKPDPLKGAAYLLQESRFQEVNAWADRNIARALVQMEPEWSLRYAQRAVELKSDNAWGHYLAGAAYYNTNRYAEADREYAIAIEDPSQRQASLREVAEMWLFSGFQKNATQKPGTARAKPYIDRLLREYPNDGRGWIMRWYYAAMMGESGASVKEIPAVLAKVDRDDPWQVERAKFLEQLKSRNVPGPIFMSARGK